MAEEYVIPPGQEAVLGTILGSGTALPGGCKLDTGNIEKTTVKATYTCPGGDVVFELSHPSAAAGDAARTEKFALRIASGTPPPDLQTAVLSRIREHENDFRWTATRPTPSGQPESAAGLSGTLVVVLVVALALLTLRLLRRRGRSTAA